MNVKKTSILLLMLGMVFCTASYAGSWDAIYKILEQMAESETGINAHEASIEGYQNDIDKLMKELNESTKGNYGWGNFQTHDYQSYGDSANNWSSVMQLASSGGGSGALGQTVNGMSHQFPIDKNSFNNGISNPASQTYYAVQSQTVLATRAASQLDYDKIKDQISYQQMLQQQIEKTKDLKSAVDLNNRIQVEANLINLEVLRQSALSNQQHAISEQANINSALQNAKFLTKP